jgi:hypothetical protein
LVEVIAEVPAPDEVAGKIAVGKGHDVDGLVGEEGEGGDEELVALAAGDGAFDQALAEKFEDAVVGSATEGGPGVEAEQGGVGRNGTELLGTEVTVGEAGRRGRKRVGHGLRAKVGVERRRAMSNARRVAGRRRADSIRVDHVVEHPVEAEG